MTGWPSSYYEELRGKVLALLIMIQDQLPSATVKIVAELVDANEPGVALETMSEMLVESGEAITLESLALVDDLVRTMQLDSVNVERLRSLVK